MAEPSVATTATAAAEAAPAAIEDAAAAATVEALPSSTASSADAPSAAPAASPSAASSGSSGVNWMFTHLRGDVGSQFALLSLLTLNDCAPLNATCHTWRRWFATDGALPNKRRAIRPTQVDMLLGCPWVRLHIRTLEIEPEPPFQSTSKGLKALKEAKAALESEAAALAHLLKAMPTSFLHLGRLEFKVTSAIRKVEVSLLDGCFAALAPRLEHVRLVLPAPGDCDVIVWQMKRLRKLQILGEMDAPQEVDLSALPSLPLFQSFELADGCEWHATPLQCQHLSRCTSLRWLQAGIWSPDESEFDEDPTDPAWLAHLDATLGVIVRGAAKTELRKLWLAETVLHPPVFELLMDLPLLDTIWAGPLRKGISPASWARLPALKALTRLSLTPDEFTTRKPPRFSCVQLSDFLTPLLQCSLLHHLQLGKGLVLRRSDLELMVAHLPHMWSLTLVHVMIESITPLAGFAKLHKLRLGFCTDVTGTGDPQVREGFPACAQLLELRIEDDERWLRTDEQAEITTLEIVAKCPQLKVCMQNKKERMGLLGPGAANAKLAHA